MNSFDIKLNKLKTIIANADKEYWQMTKEEYERATGYPQPAYIKYRGFVPEYYDWVKKNKSHEDILRKAIAEGKVIPQNVVDSLPDAIKSRLFPEMFGEAPFQMTQEEFERAYLVHGTTMEEGEDITFIEPRIGDFTRRMYEGSWDGPGIMEDYGAKELAYFKRPSEVERVEHYCESCDVYPKKGNPYILLAQHPGDVMIADEDDTLYDEEGNVMERGLPLGVESGDIVSESGASVAARIPLQEWRERKKHIDSLHKYLVWKALTEGKKVPKKVLKQYPDLVKGNL